MNDKEPDIVQRLVDLLTERPGLTCTEIGETLWGTHYRDRQAYARPAGKVAKRAIEAGLVREGVERSFGYPRRVFYPARR